MLKKSILVTALLLLATVQVFAADCDLRCALMAGSHGSQECGSHAQMARGHDRMEHCQGMAMMGADNQCSSVMSGSGCGVAVCRARFDAIDKKSAPDESTSKSISPTFQALLIHPVDDNTWTRSFARRSPDRRDVSAPLDLRPGSSLRI